MKRSKCKEIASCLKALAHHYDVCAETGEPLFYQENIGQVCRKAIRKVTKQFPVK